MNKSADIDMALFWATLTNNFKNNSVFSDKKYYEEIAGLVQSARQFYTYALDRDQIMADKGLRFLKDHQMEYAVMVTGGFHTRGIEKILENDGISYVTLIPEVSDLGDDAIYEERMMSPDYDFNNIEFSEKRIAMKEFYHNSAWTLATPDTFGSILEDIAQGKYEAIASRLLEGMLRDYKVKNSSTKALYELIDDWMQEGKNLEFLNDLAFEEIWRVLEAVSKVYPGSVFDFIMELNPQNATQGEITNRVLDMKLSTFPGLLAITRVYFNKAPPRESEKDASVDSKIVAQSDLGGAYRIMGPPLTALMKLDLERREGAWRTLVEIENPDTQTYDLEMTLADGSAYRETVPYRIIADTTLPEGIDVWHFREIEGDHSSPLIIVLKAPPVEGEEILNRMFHIRHEIREEYLERRGLNSRDAHILAAAQDIVEFSEEGQLLPYHEMQLRNASPESLHNLILEYEMPHGRDYQHGLIGSHLGMFALGKIEQYEFFVNRTLLEQTHSFEEIFQKAQESGIKKDDVTALLDEYRHLLEDNGDEVARIPERERQNFLRKVFPFEGYAIERVPSSRNLSFAIAPYNYLYLRRVGEFGQKSIVRFTWDSRLGLIMYSIAPDKTYAVYEASPVQNVNLSAKKDNNIFANSLGKGPSLSEWTRKKRNEVENNQEERKHEFDAIIQHLCIATQNAQTPDPDLINRALKFPGIDLETNQGGDMQISSVEGNSMRIYTGVSNKKYTVHILNGEEAGFFLEAVDEEGNSFLFGLHEYLEKAKEGGARTKISALPVGADKGETVQARMAAFWGERQLVKLIDGFRKKVLEDKTLNEIKTEMAEQLNAFSPYHVMIAQQNYLLGRRGAKDSESAAFGNDQGSGFNGRYYITVSWDDGLGLLVWIKGSDGIGSLYLPNKDTSRARLIGRGTNFKTVLASNKAFVKPSNQKRRDEFKQIIRQWWEVQQRGEKPTPKMIERARTFEGFVKKSSKNGVVSFNILNRITLTIHTGRKDLKNTVRFAYREDVGLMVVSTGEDGKSVIGDLHDYLTEANEDLPIETIPAYKIGEFEGQTLETFLETTDADNLFHMWIGFKKLKDIIKRYLILVRRSGKISRDLLQEVTAFNGIRGVVQNDGHVSFSPITNYELNFSEVGNTGQIYVLWTMMDPILGLVIYFEFDLEEKEDDVTVVKKRYKAYTLDRYIRKYPDRIEQSFANPIGAGESIETILQKAKDDNIVLFQEKREVLKEILDAYQSAPRQKGQKKISELLQTKILEFGAMPIVLDSFGHKSLGRKINLFGAGTPGEACMLKLYLSQENDLQLKIMHQDGSGELYQIKKDGKTSKVEKTMRRPVRYRNVTRFLREDDQIGALKYNALTILGQTGFRTVWDYLRELSMQPVVYRKDLELARRVYDELFALYQRNTFIPGMASGLNAELQRIRIELKRMKVFLKNPELFTSTFLLGEYGQLTIRQSAQLKVPRTSWGMFSDATRPTVPGRFVQDFPMWDVDSVVHVEAFHEGLNDYEDVSNPAKGLIQRVNVMYGDEELPLSALYGVFGSQEPPYISATRLIENGFERGFEGWMDTRSMPIGRLQGRGAKQEEDIQPSGGAARMIGAPLSSEMTETLRDRETEWRTDVTDQEPELLSR
ncbi:MAG: hypothetical protein Q8Q33_01515, partial [Chlamydiota bacterium]|nr:hypothetical protein [Chlamydiota bacterium]